MIQQNPFADTLYMLVVSEYEINGQKVWHVFVDAKEEQNKASMFVSDLDLKSFIGARKFYANIRQAMKENGFGECGTIGCGLHVYQKETKKFAHTSGR